VLFEAAPESGTSSPNGDNEVDGETGSGEENSQILTETTELKSEDPVIIEETRQDSNNPDTEQPELESPSENNGETTGTTGETNPIEQINTETNEIV
jgi:hypothetical protein